PSAGSRPSRGTGHRRRPSPGFPPTRSGAGRRAWRARGRRARPRRSRSVRAPGSCGCAGSRRRAARASTRCSRRGPSPGRGSRTPACPRTRCRARARRRGAGRSPPPRRRGPLRRGTGTSTGRRCAAPAACPRFRPGYRPRTRRSTETCGSSWLGFPARRGGGGRREAGGGRRRLELLTIRSYVEEPVKIGRPRVEAPGGGPMRRPADPRPAPAPGGKLLTITNCCGLLDPGVAGRRRMTTGGTMGQAVREPAGRTAWLTLALCCAVSVFEGYDLQAAGVVAPRVRAAFDLGPDQLGWCFSAATFGLMLGAAIGGRLSDRWGRKAVLVASVAAFGAMSVATAYSWNVESLLAARFLTGVGLGGALPNLLALVTENAPANRRHFVVGAMYAGLPT